MTVSELMSHYTNSVDNSRLRDTLETVLLPVVLVQYAVADLDDYRTSGGALPKPAFWDEEAFRDRLLSLIDHNEELEEEAKRIRNLSNWFSTKSQEVLTNSFVTSFELMIINHTSIQLDNLGVKLEGLLEDLSDIAENRDMFLLRTSLLRDELTLLLQEIPENYKPRFPRRRERF